jgi:transposase
MPKKTSSVQLRDEEYLHLRQYVREGHQSARAMNRARILLLADEQRADEEIAETLGIGPATVHRVRKNYTTGGLEQALQEKPRSGAPSKIDGRSDATLTMLACSEPPPGCARWTLQ